MVGSYQANILVKYGPPFPKGDLLAGHKNGKDQENFGFRSKYIWNKENSCCTRSLTPQGALDQDGTASEAI